MLVEEFYAVFESMNHRSAARTLMVKPRLSCSMSTCSAKRIVKGEDVEHDEVHDEDYDLLSASIQAFASCLLFSRGKVHALVYGPATNVMLFELSPCAAAAPDWGRKVEYMQLYLFPLAPKQQQD